MTKQERRAQQIEILTEILEEELRDNFKKYVDLKNEMLLEIIDKYFLLDEEKQEFQQWMNKEIYITEATINKLLAVLEIKRQSLLFQEWAEKSIAKKNN